MMFVQPFYLLSDIIAVYDQLYLCYVTPGSQWKLPIS